MEPILVLYARGAVNDIIKSVCEVSQAMGVSLWSLNGDPCTIAMRLPTIARRVCILQPGAIKSEQIAEDQMIGSVEVIRTSTLPQHCRISFLLEDLSGKVIPSSHEQDLRRFSAKTYMLLEARKLLVEDVKLETETSPIQLSNSQADTGPLHA